MFATLMPSNYAAYPFAVDRNVTISLAVGVKFKTLQVLPLHERR